MSSFCPEPHFLSQKTTLDLSLIINFSTLMPYAIHSCILQIAIDRHLKSLFSIKKPFAYPPSALSYTFYPKNKSTEFYNFFNLFIEFLLWQLYGFSPLRCM